MNIHIFTLMMSRIFCWRLYRVFRKAIKKGDNNSKEEIGQL